MLPCSVPHVYHDFTFEVSLAEECGVLTDPLTVGIHELSARAIARIATHNLRVMGGLCTWGENECVNRWLCVVMQVDRKQCKFALLVRKHWVEIMRMAYPGVCACCDSCCDSCVSH